MKTRNRASRGPAEHRRRTTWHQGFSIVLPGSAVKQDLRNLPVPDEPAPVAPSNGHSR